MSPSERVVMLPSCAVVMLLLKLWIIVNCIGGSVLSDGMSVDVINIEVVQDKRGSFLHCPSVVYELK
jgi:hypothetical protein